jgi:chemotaxis family two-component system sensor kinase Cph1
MENLSIRIREEKAFITHDPLPTILADDSQMIQVLQNLIGNAIKFHGTEPPMVHISYKDNGTEWRFSVQDNGIGINPEYKDKIFVLFQRLHNRDKYEGTGIGLAICKKIVELHGGKIWFDSRPGSGTTFYFTITKTL